MFVPEELSRIDFAAVCQLFERFLVTTPASVEDARILAEVLDILSIIASH